ncbi:bombesin receptor subtype-3 isoform X1 [Monodelphis domestica]|uniref:Bombesin receptor subtype-3 n=1 Tax=Monodelphis domestica TaxID=13616 RepID=F6R4F1_MONDO|nr:bombesin receptor subtype-3 isoform X1 [Monodelphis domestica]
MSQGQLTLPNQTFHLITDDIAPSASSIFNDSMDERRTEDTSIGSQILCTIFLTYSVIISVGLIGNVALIKVFFKIKSMQTVPNIFITSLAFGDLLLLITCVPVDATQYIADTWLFGRLGCKLLSFIQLTSVGVSVFTLTILSADRYKAIVKPLELPASDAFLKTCGKVACVWIFAMVLAIPEAVFSDLYPFYNPAKNESFEACAPYPVSEKNRQEAHSLLCFLVFYIIPLTVISVYYVLIARALYKSTIEMPAEEQEHARKQIESRKRVAKTVLVLVGFFAVCWLPNHLLYLYRSFNYRSSIDSSTLHLVATIFSRALAFSNSCVNPFALYWLSKTFRQHFKTQIFCFKFKCPRRSMVTRNLATGLASATRSTQAVFCLQMEQREEETEKGEGQKDFREANIS